MTMRLFGDYSIKAKREEVKLLRELSEYYTNIELDLKDEKMLEKLKNDFYRLFEIKIKSIGLEPFRDDDANNTFRESAFKNTNRVSFGISSSLEKAAGVAGGGSRIKDPWGEYLDTHMYVVLSEKKLIEGIKGPKDIYHYIEGLYHEINHIKQKMLIRKRDCSLETFRYTYDSTLATKENWYKENYYTSAFELDSYSNYDVLAGIPNNLFNTEKEAIRALRAGYYRSRARQDDPIKRNELESQNDEKITVEDIEREPLLAKKFNPDGTLKTVKQLIDDMENEKRNIYNTNRENEKKDIEEACGLYFELIDQAIQREQPSIEDLDSYRYDSNIDLYKDMADYFDKQNKKITNYYRKYKLYEKYEKNRKYEVTPIEEINKYYQERISYLLDIREKCGEKEETWSWPEANSDNPTQQNETLPELKKVELGINYDNPYHNPPGTSGGIKESLYELYSNKKVTQEGVNDKALEVKKEVEKTKINKYKTKENKDSRSGR